LLCYELFNKYRLLLSLLPVFWDKDCLNFLNKIWNLINSCSGLFHFRRLYIVHYIQNIQPHTYLVLPRNKCSLGRGLCSPNVQSNLSLCLIKKKMNFSCMNHNSVPSDISFSFHLLLWVSGKPAIQWVLSFR